MVYARRVICGGVKQRGDVDVPGSVACHVSRGARHSFLVLFLDAKARLRTLMSVYSLGIKTDLGDNLARLTRELQTAWSTIAPGNLPASFS